MADKSIIIQEESVKNKIFSIRDLQVIIDNDLANLYDVSTKVLNQAVKRNIERFPDDFMFQLTKNEKKELVTNCDLLKFIKHSSSLFLQKNAKMFLKLNAGLFQLKEQKRGLMQLLLTGIVRVEV